MTKKYYTFYLEDSIAERCICIAKDQGIGRGRLLQSLMNDYNAKNGSTDYRMEEAKRLMDLSIKMMEEVKRDLQAEQEAHKQEILNDIVIELHNFCDKAQIKKAPDMGFMGRLLHDYAIKYDYTIEQVHHYIAEAINKVYDNGRDEVALDRLDKALKTIGDVKYGL